MIKSKHLVFTLLILSSNLATAFNNPASNHFKNAIQHYYHFSPNSQLTILNMQGYQQTEDYTCGPATAMALMHYYGMLSDKQMTRAIELKIAKEMGSNSDAGTSPTQLINWLQSHGFDVTYRENGGVNILYDNLKKGIPTIVEWIDWGGHWEVVMGYDQLKKAPDENYDTLLFADSGAHFQNPLKPFVDGITAFNASRFDTMWFDAQYFNPGHLVKGIYIVAVPKKKAI